MRLFRILKKPITTEKTSNLSLIKNTYVFEVSDDATKIDIKKAIKEYTERRWSNFLGKLGPYPASSSIFWQIINRARTQKKSSSIPTLLVDGRKYESDKDKANLFAKVLGETFTETGVSTDFDSTVYSYVEDFVSKIDYSDDQFA